MPAAPRTPTVAPDQARYRAILQEAAAGGSALMGKLVAAARTVLQAQEAAARDLRVRDALAESANLLRKHEPQLCKAYPDALLQAFSNPHEGKPSTALSVADVHFDQLELMDDVQVQTSVTLARLQQVAMLTVEASLAELNTLICGVLGMSRVRADVNPLRPDVYVSALKVVVAQTQLPAATQMQWFSAMSATLGQELRILYVAQCAQLRKDGVVSVGYAMPSSVGARSGGGTAVGGGGGSSDSGGGGRPVAHDGSGSQSQELLSSAPSRARSPDENLLTLDRLRRLLSGELEAMQGGNTVEQFAARFAQQFEDAGPIPSEPTTDFANTVPAALEALTEMKQVDRVVHSLEQRRKASATGHQPQQGSIEGQRINLRRNAKDVAQALSLEVVTLMVENMAHDARLLEPVRQVIRELEPALLRLALVDQRFFTDKQHPARRLLQELTHRSMGFESQSASGFDSFVNHLRRVLEPLCSAPIESAEVFERHLNSLQMEWHDTTRSSDGAREAAVEALQHAEARNLLAEKIAKGIETHPDSMQVAPVVIGFLCGPWAQVVAEARIMQGAGSEVAEKFEALIPSLLWSAHPVLARANPAKLTRVVPRLLMTLREGLDTIQYPATRTSVFLEALMAIHQQVLRHVHGTATSEAAAGKAAVATTERLRLVEDGNPWIAPQEALASNFVELQESAGELPVNDAPIQPDMLIVAGHGTPEEVEMPLGSWVELWSNGQWLRTQLTWASPHGTLYLFTGLYGTTQSMSRRSREKLLATGKLRLISGQPVDEGALDAVAQAAMHNSVQSAN